MVRWSLAGGRVGRCSAKTIIHRDSATDNPDTGDFSVTRGVTKIPKVREARADAAAAATLAKLLEQLETIVHSAETPVSQQAGRWLPQMRYVTRHQNDVWSRRWQRWKYRLQHRLRAA